MTDIEVRLNNLEEKVARVAELLAAQIGQSERDSGSSFIGVLGNLLGSLNEVQAMKELRSIAAELRA